MCNEFLREFVDELNSLLRVGEIIINNHVIRINFKCFIMDTPARALIKGIISIIRSGLRQLMHDVYDSSRY